MIEVLLVSVAAAPADSLAAARRLHGTDVRLRLAAFTAVADLPDSPLFTERHSFALEPSQLGRQAAAAAQKAPAPRRAWINGQRDPWLRARARKANVIVALDAQAVYTVWQLAQVNTGAHACHGATAALYAVADRRKRPLHYRWRDAVGFLPAPRSLARAAGRRVGRQLRAAALKAIGPRVLRTGPGALLWRTVATAPGLPENARFRLATHVADGFRKADRPGEAVLTLSKAADRTHGVCRRAGLLAAAGLLELRRGVVPTGLADVIAAQAACADHRWRKGDGQGAAVSLARAMELAFHRVLHLDRTESPMSDNPETFLAPLSTSKAFAAMTAGAGRDQPAAPPPADRPLRLLFVTRKNVQFLTEIRERYEKNPAVEVRSLDIAMEPSLEGLITSDARMAALRLGADMGFKRTVEECLRPHLDWADTVFIDWCTGPAVLFTAVDPGKARIVVRLHSFETFSRWPFLTDFSRVDDIVFVGAHLRDLAVSVVPGLQRPDAPRLHVIPNAMDLDRFDRPKDDGARFTLGLVGISAVAKDPRWALAVLRLLRAEDERYRLFLIGADVDGSLSPAAREYADEYQREVAALEAMGAVRRLGQLSDVPGALTSVGVILSSSVRESFHCGLVEGAASGAVPVARDWPFFAGKPNGAHTLFPASWLVGTPRGAADRIRVVTASEDVWRVAAKEAADVARTTWGWPVIAREFDNLLLDVPGASAPR
jgi:glycosyltransferase involved in cell wall biosynthesis